MFRLLAACTVAVSFAACATQAPPKPAAQSVAPLRFVKPPLVLYDAGQQTITVWVRLNRPLRHNVGHPAEFGDHGASLEAAGGGHDIAGMAYSPLRPTCYSEGLSLGKSAPELSDGQQLEVSLRLSDTQSLTSTGTVRVPDASAPPAAAQLECPQARHTRACNGTVNGKHLTLGVASAKFTSCRVARNVMQRVGRWANSNACYERLCASAHRANRGFRCVAALNGEASWDIVCRKGRAEVRAYTSE